MSVSRLLPAKLFPVVGVLVLTLGCADAPRQPTDTNTANQTAMRDQGDSPTDALGLSDFHVFPEDDDSWKEGETLYCEGKTKGYIYTNESFGNGTISFDYRYPAASESDEENAAIPNTGLLLLIEPPHKKWPRCIEAQGKQSEAGQLKGNGGVTDLSPKFDDNALAEAISPPGEWNSVSVVISDTQIVASWNGRQTAKCQRNGLSAGPFGLQSEGNPVEFRNIRFVPAESVP